MSSFGTFFRVSTFGESHCPGVGCVVDGVPPRIRLTEADIQVFKLLPASLLVKQQKMLFVPFAFERCYLTSKVQASQNTIVRTHWTILAHNLALDSICHENAHLAWIDAKL